MRAFEDSTALRDDGEALRARAERDGYLLIRGLLDPRKVQSVGEEMASIAADAGWIEPGKPFAHAKANLDKRCVEPQPDFMTVFYKQLSCKSLHALKADSQLMSFFDLLFDDQAFCVPHCVMRMAFPEMDSYATPAHQDYVHFEGSTRNWAAWIPFTPITEQNGGLAIASGSHREGAYDMRPTLGAGQMVIDADLHAFDWRTGTLELGDVLIHNCLTVHKGLANKAKTLRVSVDARYQPRCEPVGEKHLGVSHQMKSWEELYTGWEGDEYKYYWRKHDLEVVPFEYRWYDRRDKRAIAMGEAGDPEAAVALENITLKHRDADMRERAARALAQLNAS